MGPVLLFSEVCSLDSCRGLVICVEIVIGEDIVKESSKVKSVDCSLSAEINDSFVR